MFRRQTSFQGFNWIQAEKGNSPFKRQLSLPPAEVKKAAGVSKNVELGTEQNRGQTEDKAPKYVTLPINYSLLFQEISRC